MPRLELESESRRCTFWNGDGEARCCTIRDELALESAELTLPPGTTLASRDRASGSGRGARSPPLCSAHRDQVLAVHPRAQSATSTAEVVGYSVSARAIVGTDRNIRVGSPWSAPFAHTLEGDETIGFVEGDRLGLGIGHDADSSEPGPLVQRETQLELVLPGVVQDVDRAVAALPAVGEPVARAAPAAGDVPLRLA